MNTSNNARIPHCRLYALAGTAIALLAGAASAQSINPRSAPTPRAPQSGGSLSTAAVELNTETWRLDAVGLSMFLPIDSLAQSSTVGGKSSVQITPTGGESTWIINIQTAREVNADTTAADICDSIVDKHFRGAGEVREIREDDPTRSREAAVKGTLIEPRRAIKIGDLQSERVYFSVPGTSFDSSNADVVRGLTVFKTSATQFVVFELVTLKSAFERTRPIYEATVATAVFEDPAKLSLARAAGIAAGQKILGENTAERLKAVIKANPVRWERCYRPAASGADSDATELGYRRITASIGARNANGMLGGNNEGYLVESSARMLDKGTVIDSVATYFLSLDLKEETWAVQNGITKGTQTQAMTERGARAEKSMVVQIEGTGVGGREVRPVFASDGYISRVESALLPMILVNSGIATEYGFYSYLSDELNVCYRREVLEQPADKPGLWKLTTKLSDKKPPMVSYFNAKGTLMRQELPDGAVWEPVTFEKLVQLWQQKNLPMGKRKN